MGLVDLKGKQFSRLKVISRSFPNTKAGKTRWSCECMCGKSVTVIGGSLKSGATKSCGCLRVTSNIKRTKHGHSKRGKITRTYQCWGDMVKRTTNPKHWAWKYYGGRGIKICDPWLKFENFLKDMGTIPDKLTLDRINNDGGYHKDNCRWATRSEQSRNRRPFSVSKRGG